MPENILPESFFYELAARVSEHMMKELPSEDALSSRITFSPAFEERMNTLLSNS